MKKNSFKEFAWSAGETAGTQVSQLVISIILARILMPSEFGILAMAMVFINISIAFVDSGFGAALIQKKHVTAVDKSTIFYFNLIVALFFSTLLYFCSSAISSFYGYDQLDQIVQIICWILVINAIGNIQRTVLTKDVNFKPLFKVNIIAGLIGGAVAIYMAMNGYGIWSLVGQQMTKAITSTILLWSFVRWLPQLKFSLQSLKELFPFGSQILAAGILERVFNNIYVVVIGRVYSAEQLGYYSRANGLQAIPSEGLNRAVSRVTFPLFSAIQDEKVELKATVKKILRFYAFINFPLMVGMAAVAEPLILLLLTEKWATSIPYFQLLCCLGALLPFHAINVNVLKAQGRADLNLRIQFLKKALILAAVILTYRWGIPAMILGAVAVSCICLYINSYFSGKLINYGFFEQCIDMVKVFVLSTIMGLVVYFLILPESWTLIMVVLVKILIGILSYLVLCSLFKVKELHLAIDAAKRKFTLNF